MDIDIYQYCPCNSGKKIKFCCGKGIVNDLNQILAKNSSGQTQAALDHIERVLKKEGHNDSLVTLQTHILITNGAIDKAKEVNDQFLTLKPTHTTGLHHRALIQLASGSSMQAVESLQDAMDSITGNEIPLSVANGFRMLGLGLLNESNTFAASAHLRYAFSLKGDSDQELNQLIMQVDSHPSFPMILKQDLHLAPPLADVPWEKRYTNVHRALDRGQFRKALKFLEKIDSEHPDLPIIVRGIAVVTSFLGRTDAMMDAWNRFARLPGVPLAESVEAEAIAHCFDKRNVPEPIPIIRQTIELSDTEKPNEIALSSPRLAAMPPVATDPFEEGPPPKTVFSILDRDKLSDLDEIDALSAPIMLGEMFLYGKQTDRNARIEYITIKGSSSESIESLVQEMFGEFAGASTETQVGETSKMAEFFEWNWHLPPGISVQKHDQMMEEYHRHLVLNQWPSLTFPMLDGKSPDEVASDENYHLKLQATVLLLEHAVQGNFFENDVVAELREKLGLPQLGTFEHPEQGRVTSPVLQQLLDPEKLSNEQLLFVRESAMRFNNFRVLRRILPEILKRDDIGIPKDLNYSMMAQLSRNLDEAFGYMDQAKQAAAAVDNRSLGLCLVREFDLRVRRGATEKLGAIIEEIQSNHLDDPEVEFQFVRVLDRYGIGPEQGPIRQNAPDSPTQVAEPVEATSPIWTPDQEPTSEPSGDADSGSKLWLPD